MKPLLEIRSVPISIEYKVNNAKIQRVSSHADVEITRNKGGFTMRSRPIQLNVDTFEARNSVFPTTANSIFQSAETGKQAAYEVTARFAQEGHFLLSVSHTDRDAIGEMLEARTANEKQFGIAFIPQYPAEISWTPPDFSIDYEMDKLNFDWRTDNGSFEFIPGNIEFNIREYPHVVIEYIGGPLYVPPSASPDYVPVDARA